ncbi:MAG: mucoidy inhibitor MuiA family protein [Anaerolineales bacterium]|nr:mucoidy inhibitor MuiA family protein [Anaerolineales bacterium]
MEYPVATQITAVTVYPDRARITAVGETELEPGQHQLLFDELPLTLNQDSIRVAGKGTAQVRISSVDVIQRHYEETPAADVRALEEAIEQVADELAAWQDKDNTLQTHANYVAGLWQQTEQFAKGLSLGLADVSQQGELLAFLRAQDDEIKQSRREITREIRGLKRRQTKLQAELKQKQATRPRQRFQARVEISARTAGTFQPQLTYVVNNAGWQPLYDLRLDKQGVRLTYIAQITQRSGQDWQGAALTVSTARPALNQRLPDLHPWFVDVMPPRPPRPEPRVRAAMMMKAEAGAEMMADSMPEPVAMAAPVMEAEVAVATAERSGTAVTFRVGGGSDIPSDGRPHKTTIAEFDLEPELDYIAVPKHTDAVYRRVKVTNVSESPLLAGAANLFADAEYIGQTQIGYTAVGEEVELLLGVEERITIQRELKRRDVDKTFMRDKRRIQFGYEIEVENLLAEAVKVTVRDHFPKSRHEQIKVELKACNPAVVEQSDLNLLEWQLNLPPQTKHTIRYEYLVEYPTQLVVQGLEQ